MFNAFEKKSDKSLFLGVKHFFEFSFLHIWLLKKVFKLFKGITITSLMSKCLISIYRY